jgi:putative transposase
MSKLRRYFLKGQSYFVTLVFYQRRRIPDALFDTLYRTIIEMAAKHDSVITAWIILGDHIHLIVTPQENVLDRLIHDIKLSFGVAYRKAMDITAGRLWENRYWDHVIRDQADMNRHIDYIHYNPVRHGYVKGPFDWVYSSIHEYRVKGYYPDDWGVAGEIVFEGSYGETEMAGSHGSCPT